MSSIWNLSHPLRTGHIDLAASGRELFGTVVRQGRMDKTVAVSRWKMNTRYGKKLSQIKNFHVHDDENYCRIGDKVVIRHLTKKMAKSKYYYVRNIVLAVGRHTYYSRDLTQYEVNAIDYNKELRDSMIY